jgi:hypothetical protein
MTLQCPYCGNGTMLTSGKVIYADRWPHLAGKQFWACDRYPTCDAYVGCHPGTETPLGRLANKELRKWKLAAHAAFDPLWKRKLEKRRAERGAEYKKAYARGSAYKWLAEQLGVSREECHIGMFDVATCRRVVALCEPYTSRLRRAG